MITREEIARLKELESKCESAPWLKGAVVEGSGIHFVKTVYNEKIADCTYTRDGVFIAESRNILPAILRDYEKLLAVYKAAKECEKKFMSIDDGFFKGLVPPEFGDVSMALRACEEEEGIKQ